MSKFIKLHIKSLNLICYYDKPLKKSIYDWKLMHNMIMFLKFPIFYFWQFCNYIWTKKIRILHLYNMYWTWWVILTKNFGNVKQSIKLKIQFYLFTSFFFEEIGYWDQLGKHRVLGLQRRPRESPKKWIIQNSSIIVFYMIHF